MSEQLKSRMISFGSRGSPKILNVAQDLWSAAIAEFNVGIKGVAECRRPLNDLLGA